MLLATWTRGIKYKTSNPRSLEIALRVRRSGSALKDTDEELEVVQRRHLQAELPSVLAIHLQRDPVYASL